jgi:hypothetical protein
MVLKFIEYPLSLKNLPTNSQILINLVGKKELMV